MEHKQTGTPKISVVFPVFNAHAFLKEAIESILAQTLGDFELLIIDDGSTDNSLDIARSYQDPRIHIIERQHEGLVPTLNAGLANAKGEYIARMDSDDIALPERFQKQVEYLDANGDVGVLGTAWRDISMTGMLLDFSHIPEDHESIVNRFSTIENYMGHPTLMMRTDVVRRISGYCKNYTHAEDLDFLIRLSETTRLANLPKVLLLCRRHPGSVSGRHAFEQERSAFLAVKAWEQRKAGIDENLNVAIKAWETYVEAGGEKLRRERLVRILDRNGVCCVYGGKSWEAFKAFFQIWCIRPFAARSYINFLRIIYRRPFRKAKMT